MGDEKGKKLELKANKMSFQLRVFYRIYVKITYRK